MRFCELPEVRRSDIIRLVKDTPLDTDPEFIKAYRKYVLRKSNPETDMAEVLDREFEPRFSLLLLDKNGQGLTKPRLEIKSPQVRLSLSRILEVNAFGWQDPAKFDNAGLMAVRLILLYSHQPNLSERSLIVLNLRGLVRCQITGAFYHSMVLHPVLNERYSDDENLIDVFRDLQTVFPKCAENTPLRILVCDDAATFDQPLPPLYKLGSFASRFKDLKAASTSEIEQAPRVHQTVNRNAATIDKKVRAGGHDVLFHRQGEYALESKVGLGESSDLEPSLESDSGISDESDASIDARFRLAYPTTAVQDSYTKNTRQRRRHLPSGLDF